jgi:hypothetical protein
MKHGRTVESFGERFPLLRREREGRLVGDNLLGARKLNLRETDG